MRCEKAHDKFAGYLTGELSEEENSQFEHHLRSCAACRQGLDRARELRIALRARTTPPLPKGFRSRLMQKARRQTQVGNGPEANPDPFYRSPSTPTGRRVVIAAGILIAIGVGILVGSDLWNRTQSRRIQTDLVAETRDYGLDYMGGTPENSVTGAYVRLTSNEQGE